MKIKTRRSLTRTTPVVCVRNDGYEAALELRKIYPALPDRQAAAENLVRVIDESGEDYLYPRAYFRPIRLNSSLRRALRFAAARR